MSKHRLRRVAAACVLLTLAPLAAACGGGGASSSADDARNRGETVTVKVGVLPSVNAASFYLGVEKGFFEDEGLKVEPQVMNGGSELTTALVSGSTQFSHVGVINSVIARSKGLPIKLVTSYLEENTTAEDAYMLLLVREGGSADPKALEGKTIAVNELRAFGEVAVRGALTKLGVDESKVKFTEVPFPEMQAALETGSVDAAWMIEPFVSSALKAGAVTVTAPSAVLGDGANFPDGAWMATEEYAAKNPEVVAAFVRAINKSTEYAAAHEDEIRAAIPTFTQVPPEVAQTIRLPHYDTELDEAGVEEWIAQAMQYGIIDKEISVGDLRLAS